MPKRKGSWPRVTEGALAFHMQLLQKTHCLHAEMSLKWFFSFQQCFFLFIIVEIETLTALEPLTSAVFWCKTVWFLSGGQAVTVTPQKWSLHFLLYPWITKVSINRCSSSAEISPFVLFFLFSLSTNQLPVKFPLSLHFLAYLQLKCVLPSSVRRPS